MRAGITKTPLAYPWSSYRATIGRQPAPDWLATEQLLAHFGGVKSYERFVADGMSSQSLMNDVHGQIWLGSESFREEMKRRIPQGDVANVPRDQLQPDRPDAATVLAIIAEHFACEVGEVTGRSNKRAYRFGAYLLRRAVNLPLAEVAAIFDVSTARISQIQSEIQQTHLLKEANFILENYKLKN